MFMSAARVQTGRVARGTAEGKRLIGMGQPTPHRKKAAPESSGRVLSAAQRAIAHTAAGTRAIVEAGPGTGKTEVVAHRIVYLLSQGLRPAHILVLSFSRSAVRTLTMRIERMQVDTADYSEDLRYLSVRTFDSWTFRMLRHLNRSPGTLLGNSHDDNINELVGVLRGTGRASVADLLKDIRHIIVDEFQDTSGVRGALVFELLNLLAPRQAAGTGFTVLGDPAQAIYGFALRNGHPDHAALSSGALISKIRKSYGKDVHTLSLEQNYRASDELGELARKLRQVLLRRASGSDKLTAMRGELDRVRVTPDGLKPSSLLAGRIRTAAILTLTNGESIRVAQKLRTDETEPRRPVVLHGSSQPRCVPPWIGAMLGPLKSSTLTRSQFRGIYAFNHSELIEALDVPSEETAWQRLARACDAGAEATAIDIGVLRARLGWADLLPDEESLLAPGIHVMTIHQSKGMEFDAVGVMAESLAERELASDEEHLEVANVLFVGMTRAAKQLLRVGPGQTYGPMYRRRSRTRERWCSWKRGWVNLEMGCSGDIDAEGFVDRRVFSEDGRPAADSVVQESQKFLAENAASLRGCRVVLRKWKVPQDTKVSLEPESAAESKHRFRYRIHLQDGDKPGRVLGLTSDALTLDLLELVYDKGYHLPATIFNLQITEVVTMGLDREAPVTLAQPYLRSGLWLGINIYGSGDFKPYK